MRFIDIIEKKREGQALTKAEIEFFIEGYTNGTIPDYQVSALLMAIYFQSMNSDEIAYLTNAMLHSGDVIDLTNIAGIKVDKHSTGGVGDKTSLALAPMVAACGVKVAKMSGRGLGHTGGTLDKVESIAGFNIELDEESFINQVNDIGLALIGQTKQVVPADKKLYALRDVTATVPSIPLIASSIMSKKLASGADTILLDVKYGEGAFMQDADQAKLLANTMIEIGKKLGKDTRAIISNMNQPLGNAIGNSLEVIEAVNTLHNQGPTDFTELCLDAGAIMLQQAKVANDFNSAKAMLVKTLEDGSAFTKLCEMVQAQGGDVKMLKDLSLLPSAALTTTLVAKEAGYVHDLHALELGTLAMLLGAGRKTKEDEIDFGVGLVLNKKIGDKVEAGEALATIYSQQALTNDWIERFYDAYTIKAEVAEKVALIESIIE